MELHEDPPLGRPRRYVNGGVAAGGVHYAPPASEVGRMVYSRFALAVPPERLQALPAIEADTEQQLLGLIRAIQVWSGRTPGRIATYVKIPRSSAYRIVAPDTRSLPQDRSRLALFLTGCGLPGEHIEQVLALWDTITTEKAVRAATERLASTPPAAANAAVGSADATGQVDVEEGGAGGVLPGELVTGDQQPRFAAAWRVPGPGDDVSAGVPEVFGGGPGGTYVHGNVQVTFANGTPHTEPGPGDGGAGARAGWLALFSDQGMFLNLIAGLLVLGVIAVAIIAVLTPAAIGPGTAIGVMGLLIVFAAVVLGFSWHSRRRPPRD